MSLTNTCYKDNTIDMKTIRNVLMLFTVPLLVFGQGVISRIYLSTPGLDVEIVDEKARNEFRVGVAQGTS
jgi:hypothetical protein